MQGPPWWGFAQRRRILTEASGAVNSTAALALVLALLVAAPARATRPTGELHVLVVLAGFPDRALDHPPGYFAGADTALVDRLAAYYEEVSTKRLRIVPTLGRTVVTLPRARRLYVQQPAELASDAVAAFAAAGTADDRAALAGADALLVFFAGSGRESHTQSGDPDDPWSNYTTMAPPGHGPPLHEACVIAEEEVPPFSNFGVLCHEFGHLLGLPELYAPGSATNEGVGVWDLMGQGTWLGRGETPPGLSAWSKLFLGWADADTITTTTRALALPAAGTTPRVVKIPATPNEPREYYLLENRTRAGVDRALPGEGLLVWHVDERVHSFRLSETDPRHKLLHLVEADGRNDLDRGHANGGNRGDATDPWQGPPPWRRNVAATATLVAGVLVAFAVLRAARARAAVPVAVLLGVAVLLLVLTWPLRAAPVCGPGTPGMSPYDGGPVRVVIRNISPAGPVMHADVLVAPAGRD